MFCPNCGASNTTEQKFCRSCGLNLEQTARSLLEQVPSAESASLLRKQRVLEKFGNVAFTGFVVAVAIAVIGLIYTVFVKMVLTGANPLVGIVFMALMISPRWAWPTSLCANR